MSKKKKNKNKNKNIRHKVNPVKLKSEIQTKPAEKRFTRQWLTELLKRKFSSMIMIIIPAFAIMLILSALLWALRFVLPAGVLESISYYAHNPRELRTLGEGSEWVFILVQVLQVVIAPIPGQAAAFAGGFIFGFWKGWFLTTLGLVIGSLIAMTLARLLGISLVRRIVPDSIIQQFDKVISEGGYMTFFMIFLLPALPDDAVCFLAGLTKLKLFPLSIVCLLGRAPGMLVLSLTGAGFADGLTLWVEILFAVMMIASVLLWLFWEVIEEWVYDFLKIKR
ncbi:MAG: TVP38/TMEM64 family protein [Synergistaceae bacterium]|nr:TVP38/TMEM64 family protein [Synergistaceae bacterium]